jgi:hypothetical protein
LIRKPAWLPSATLLVGYYFPIIRPGVVNLLSPQESKKSLELAVTAWKTRSELVPKIGKGKYVLAEYEKIKRITMPFGENYLVYITTEAQADHNKIIEGVRRLASSLR